MYFKTREESQACYKILVTKHILNNQQEFCIYFYNNFLSIILYHTLMCRNLNKLKINKSFLKYLFIIIP